MIRLLPRTTAAVRARTRMTITLNASRALSTRASGVLSALGLPTDQPIQGVYDGQWGGSGPVVESHCPTTGEVIARVQTVSVAWVVASSQSHSRADGCPRDRL